MTELVTVGQRMKRFDAPQKLTGVERFTGDLRFPGRSMRGRSAVHWLMPGYSTSTGLAALAIPGVVDASDRGGSADPTDRRSGADEIAAGNRGGALGRAVCGNCGR